MTDDIITKAVGEEERKPRLRVVECHPPSDPRWDRFVLNHARGIAYQTAGWFEVLHRAYDYDPVALACEDGSGQLVGVLPMFRRRAGLLTRTRYYSSLPQTPCAGPLVSSDDALAALLLAAAGRLEEEHGSWLHIRSSIEGLDRWVPGRVSTRTTYVLDLSDHDTLPKFGNSRNHKSVARSVRRSKDLGIRVRTAEAEADLRRWYSLYLETMRWNFTLPHPYEFFRIVWDVLGAQGKARLLLADKSGANSRLIAGTMLLRAGTNVSYAWLGRSQKDIGLRADDTLYWTSIMDGWQTGCRRFDMGEVRDGDDGLAQFKGKWGATAQSYYLLHCAGRTEIKAGDSGQIRRRQGRARKQLRNAYCATWRNVPLRVTATVGRGWYFWF